MHFAEQFTHPGITGIHLKPELIAEPQLDAVEAGLLDKRQPFLKGPAVGYHVIADGFLHSLMIRPAANATPVVTRAANNTLAARFSQQRRSLDEGNALQCWVRLIASRRTGSGQNRICCAMEDE
jgi:hypothetical protein